MTDEENNTPLDAYLKDESLYLDTFEDGYAAALQDFEEEVNKWEQFSLRGMKQGNPVYHQGRIGLIVNLWDYIAGQRKKIDNEL